MSAVAVISTTSVLFFESLNANLNKRTRSKNNIRYQRTMLRAATCTLVVYLASLAIIFYFEDVETKEIIVKQLKVGIHMKAVFWLVIMFLMQISRLRYKQSRISMLISHMYVLGRVVNFLVISRYVYLEIYMLFTGWEVRMGKNGAGGLEGLTQDQGHSFFLYGPT